MLINRAAFLAAIEAVKPAVATKDLMEELCCVWFDGNYAIAYNDASLGIRVPFKSEFQGGIRGLLLLGMLAASRAKDVEIEPLSDGNALFKIFKARLKLALLDPKKAVYELPDLKKAAAFKLPKVFINQLKAVSIAIGNASGVPDQMGVTFIQHNGELCLFTTDGKRVAWGTIKGKEWPVKERVTIPTEFIDQLIKVADGETTLYVGKGYVAAENKDRLLLFARLVDVPKPNNFVKICQDAIKGTKAIPIPNGFHLAIDRTMVLLNGHTEQAADVEVIDDVLRFHAKTPHGELKESIGLKDPPKKMEFRINPEHIKVGLELCDKIALSDEVTIMYGPSFTYLITPYG